MAPVHFVILLLALGVLVLCFMPAYKEAQAGRTAWPWALGAILVGPYVLLAWLFVVLRRRRMGHGGPQ
jgi:hypothetical protein